jgi:hypothetical protein
MRRHADGQAFGRCRALLFCQSGDTCHRLIAAGDDMV